MTAQTVLLRMIDGFFRRKWLYLIPIVLLGVLGFMSAATEDDYNSEGTMFVQEETFLSQLTEVRQDGLSFQTPAALASEQLWGLLQTDTFIAQVIELSGQEAALGQPGQTTEQVFNTTREAISTWPTGQNFLNVGATWDDPQIAHDLSLATVEGMVQWQIDADQVQSREAETFFAGLVETYRTDLTNVRNDLNSYLLDHPDPIDNTVRRPMVETVAIDAFQSQIRLAETNLENALDKAEEARLATAQTRSDVRQGFLIVDPPNLPTSPENGLLAILIRTFVFGIVGAFAGAAILLLTTLLESTKLRFPIEITERLDLPVAAVVVRQP